MELQGAMLTLTPRGPAWALEPWAALAKHPGGALEPLDVAARPSGRWAHRVRITGRVLPSPEDPDTPVVLVTTTSGPGS